MRHIPSTSPCFYLYIQIYCRFSKVYGQTPFTHHDMRFLDLRCLIYQSLHRLSSTRNDATISKLPASHQRIIANIIRTARGLSFSRSFTSPKQDIIKRKTISKIFGSNVQLNGASKRSLTVCTVTAEEVSGEECQTNHRVDELVSSIIQNGTLSVQDVLGRWLKSLTSTKNLCAPYNDKSGDASNVSKCLFVSYSDVTLTKNLCAPYNDKSGDASNVSKCLFVSYSDVTFVIHGVMKELARRELVDYVFQVLDWMDIQGWFNLDHHLCANIITNLSKSGSLQIVEKVFHRLDEIKVQKSSVVYNVLLNAYSKAGQTKIALKLFEDMKQKCKADLVTFNTVMDACVRAGMDLVKVVSVFKEMCLLGIHPDIISYDVALAACAEGKHVKEARMFFQNAKKKGLKPTVVTYTSLMAVYANASECAAALRIFREMIADGCHPNEMTFSCLINAFGKEGQVEEAESIFEAMSDYVVTPNVVVYNTMIDLYNKNGLPNHAQHMFRKMIEIGMEPTYVSFTSLMSSFKALEAYEEAVDVYYSVRGNSSLCNVYTYTEALDSCLKWGNWEKVAEVLSDMQFAGCVPNFVTCSVLLAALGSRCRNAEEANIIVDFLKSYESKLLVNVRRMLVEIFDADLEVKRLAEDTFLLVDDSDTKTWAVFTSSLVDALWAFGWYRRAALVTGWALEKNDYVELIAVSSNEWKLDVRRFSSGGALVVFYQWLEFMFQIAVQSEASKFTDLYQRVETSKNEDAHFDVLVDRTADTGQLSNESVSTSAINSLSTMAGAVSSSHMFRKSEILIPFLSVSPDAMHALRRSSCGGLSNFPRMLTVVTGWGKLSTHKGRSQVKDSIQDEIVRLGAPFRPSTDYGRWVADGDVLIHWLLKPEVAEHLALHDEAAKYRE